MERHNESQGHWSAKTARGLAIAAALVLGAAFTPADATIVAHFGHQSRGFHIQHDSNRGDHDQGDDGWQGSHDDGANNGGTNDDGDRHDRDHRKVSVPEPDALALLFAGFGGLLLVQARRRHAARS